ncbi:unnamed protein product [Leptidea sinapis]|uniref:Uncharacterized protein n=1 Tax=Leptidea sinapis TaxID=189913 RepID=A0A5E4QUK7_9NEOP|nr:unnamed protein product [Leptidea sinapis]
MLNSFFNWLSNEEPPTKVLEVRSENYISRPIHYRDDSMLLYGPKASSDKRNPKDKYYEIILQKPFTESLHQMYSLYRCENKEESEERFIVFKEKIPVYVRITKDCTVPSLQKLCDILGKNKSWTIAHMVAYFGQSELLNHPDIQKHINDIAIQSGNVRMVQSLISMNCSLDIIDREGNSVYHYAAASNKEIVNAIASKSLNSLNIFNKQGYTPLHMACLANAPDCVRALLLAGADA